MRLARAQTKGFRRRQMQRCSVKKPEVHGDHGNILHFHAAALGLENECWELDRIWYADFSRWSGKVSHNQLSAFVPSQDRTYILRGNLLLTKRLSSENDFRGLILRIHYTMLVDGENYVREDWIRDRCASTCQHSGFFFGSLQFVKAPFALADTTEDRSHTHQ